MNCQCCISNSIFPLNTILEKEADAVCEIKGSSDYPYIFGIVKMYQTHSGVIVFSEISGIPYSMPQIFGFHIHEGTSCTGDGKDLFSDAGMHYNPDSLKHPFHSGDLPPLFGNQGFSVMLFLTDRFRVDEVVGKTIIIHDSPDDFTTQPSGNSGAKIACGVIRVCRS